MARPPASAYIGAVRTLAIALLTGLAGAVLAFWGGDIATRAHRVSDMEGGRAMFLVFVAAPVGFVAAAIVGWLTARGLPGEGAGGFVKAQAAAIGITALVAGVITGAAWWVAPRAPELAGAPLALDFEVRMPGGRELPDTARFSVLVTSQGRGDDRRLADLQWDATTRSDDRIVIPASAELRTRTRQRFLVVNDSDGAHYWFDLPLPARPGAEREEWTGWWPAPGESATTDIHGNGGFQIRYRVRRIESPDG